MSMKKKLFWLLTLFFLVGIVAPAMADTPVPIKTCWMESSEAFNMWLAKKMGWDKNEGLDVDMIVFDSGPAQMEALPAKQWQMGGTGVGGQLIGGMRYKIYNLAPVVDEGEVNTFWIRANSPISKVKGFNPDFPDLYGSPETVKGATILFTSQTTVHYIIGKWLNALGLKESDVKLTNLDQSSIPVAFEKGIGDVASVWAPFNFTLQRMGMVKAGSTRSSKAFTATTLVGDKEWCDANPELVAKFLRVYFRASQAINEQKGSDKIVALYRDFLNDFCGLKSQPQEAAQDLAVHPRWSLEEALKLSTPNGSNPSTMTTWLNNSVEFFASIGRFSANEAEKFKKANIATDKFLKMASAKPLGDTTLK